MPLLSCRLCGKLFTSAGGRTCSVCVERLDMLYPRVRTFLRDHPDIEFNVDTLADDMEVDIRDIQTLVDLGYLDRDLGRNMQKEDNSKQRLIKELEDSLKQMKTDSERRNSAQSLSYGQQRYGEKEKKK